MAKAYSGKTQSVGMKSNRPTQVWPEDFNSIAADIENVERRPLIQVTNDNYTIADWDDNGVNIHTILVTTGAVNRTISFPDVANNLEREIVVKKMDIGIGDVICDGYESQTMEGAATQTITQKFTALTFKAYSAGWVLVGKVVGAV